MPERLKDTTFEYHVGVQVDDSEADYPDPAAVTVAPGWIDHLKQLEHVVGDTDERKRLLVNERRAGNGRRGLGKRKLPLADKFLPGKSWLAKGYADGWALGVKSVPVAVEDLSSLCAVTERLFLDWYATATAGHPTQP